MKTITNVKVGDYVICFDEYLHDYEEHELIIHHIESDPEYATNTNPLGIVCFGKDLTTLARSLLPQFFIKKFFHKK